MRKLLSTLLGLTLFAGCSNTITLEDRPGGTIAQSRADHDACHEEVRRQPDLYVPPQSTLAGDAGAGAIAGVASVVQEERAVGECMAQRGYAKRTLTPDETKVVRAASDGAARERALDEAMQANDPVPSEVSGVGE